VRDVALAQRRVMWVILAALLLVISFAFGWALPRSMSRTELVVAVVFLIGARLAIVVFMMMGVYKLTRAMGASTTKSVLAMLSMLVPYIGLIVLLVVNQRATKLLTKSGLKVGLMGVRLADIPAS
jgi:hypothetical protein